jgi:hypothetical protein
MPSLNSCGVCPVIFLKQRAKYAADSNPTDLPIR